MKRIILSLIAASLVLSLFSCQGKNNGKEVVSGTLEAQYEYEDELVTAYYNDPNPSYPGDIDRSEFSPITRFFATSDINNKAQQLSGALKTYISASDDGVFNDAVIFLGNLTDGASIDSLARVKTYISELMPEDPVALPIPTLKDISLDGENFESDLGYSVNRHIISNNTHIITVTCDADGTYSSSVAWLGEEISSAERENSEAAIIVACGSEITEEVDAVLSKHPGVVLLTPEASADSGIVAKGEYTVLSLGDKDTLYVFEFDKYSRMLVRCLDYNGNIQKNADGTDTEYFIQTPWISENTEAKAQS